MELWWRASPTLQGFLTTLYSGGWLRLQRKLKYFAQQTYTLRSKCARIHEFLWIPACAGMELCGGLRPPYRVFYSWPDSILAEARIHEFLWIPACAGMELWWRASSKVRGFLFLTSFHSGGWLRLQSKYFAKQMYQNP
jgi:hypothetical protein